jgi:type III restriction enzyme
MKFLFQSNLEYQINAVNAVVKIFDGQSKVSPKESVLADGVCSNVLNIDEKKILENTKLVVESNKILSPEFSEDLDFTIEMETGTGKTYVYLRTIFEMHKLYGLHKFIIIVPSVAVRAGVLKTLESTEDHFKELYATGANVIEYDRKNIARLKNGFCYSNGLSILVTTTAAFNSETNIINQERDSTGGEKLIDLIAQTQPIIIMDEPQEGMDAEQTAKYITKFKPLVKIRYSATHKIKKNIVYQLNSIEAYKKNLVKKIEVLSVFESGSESNLTLELQEIVTGKSFPEAKVLLSTRKADGTFKNKSTTIKDRDILEQKTSNPVYAGWVVEKIQVDMFTKVGTIKFSNGKVFKVGEKHGIDTNAIFRSQIKYAIQNHLQKKAKLVPLNIKPICLFFIDKVSNYVDNEGLIRKLFIEEYTNIYNSQNGKNPESIDKIHGGYFAKTTNGEYTDSESSMKTNKEIYNLILRDKEKLLSLDEPLEFIFSHSALGVGWDNPNVFTICTLKETVSNDRKRQEIGRGLRICVDTNGQRVYDYIDSIEGQEINILTVIPNQSYESFAATYQQELEEDTGIKGSKMIRNAKTEPTQTNLKQELLESKVFQDLWSRINTKTEFNVNLDEQILIKNCVSELENIVTTKPTLSITIKRIKALDKENLLQGQYIGETQEDAKFDAPPVSLIREIISKTSLSPKTTRDILQGLTAKTKSYLVQNPLDFVSQAIIKIQSVVNDLMLDAVRYTTTSNKLSDEIFTQEFQTLRPTLSLTKSLYENMPFDSDPEMKFANELDKSDKVKVFVKLPKKYTIDTPIGTYNPDFAFVVENSDMQTNKSRFHFVVETKSTRNILELTQDEQIKIKCAIKHFEALGIEPITNAKYLAPIRDKEHFNQEVQRTEGYSQGTLF